MKVFETSESWAEKVNFVDDNNAFVGFDMEWSCCERFGHFLTRTKPVAGVKPAEGEILEGIDFPGYNFDTTFIEYGLYPCDDCGGSVTFRLTNGSAEMFLTLYNHHNGYYRHGWEIKYDGKEGTEIDSGTL